jgi:hypothetical protein
VGLSASFPIQQNDTSAALATAVRNRLRELLGVQAEALEITVESGVCSVFDIDDGYALEEALKTIFKEMGEFAQAGVLELETTNDEFVDIGEYTERAVFGPEVSVIDVLIAETERAAAALERRMITLHKRKDGDHSLLYTNFVEEPLSSSAQNQ